MSNWIRYVLSNNFQLDILEKHILYITDKIEIIVNDKVEDGW